MIPQLVFHLGDRKCGSTSIQHALAQKLWTSEHRSLAFMARDHNGPLAQCLVDMQDSDRAGNRFANLATRLARVEADVAVVSSESFEDVSPRALAQMIESYLPEYQADMRLIAYVRPHGARILSGYAEQIKRGQSLADLGEFFAEGVFLERFEYFNRFKAWKQVFGPRFELRVLDRSRLKGSCVVQDFLDFALEGAAFTLQGPIETNPSLCLQDLAVLREVHRVMGANPARASELGAKLADILAVLPRGKATKLQFPKALVQDTFDLCRQDAENMDKMFFEDTPMMDALTALSAHAVPDMPSLQMSDYYDADQIRLIRALIALL